MTTGRILHSSAFCLVTGSAGSTKHLDESLFSSSLFSLVELDFYMVLHYMVTLEHKHRASSVSSIY